MSDASYTQVTGKLDCNKCVWGTRDGGCASWECEFIDRDDAVKAWRNLPSAEPEPQWIPTSKERPPQHQEIWITDDLGTVELVYGKVGVWWLDENYYTEPEIIAWMPASVPEPYREVKE
jgi:hypothetical protein